ncbi:MAG: hypothetical protein R3E90_10155 [Marinicella sp.]|nr:hypothetical protein [Xanthomonadales bacterium]
MTDKKRKIPQKWEDEKKAIRATQVAFDVGEQVQYVIRKEALDRNVNPSDRIRQILGLKVLSKPKRLRLSVSLNNDEMAYLAKVYQVDAGDPIEIKRRAAEKLVEHVKNTLNNKE